jgi:hypothetical protein
VRVALSQAGPDQQLVDSLVDMWEVRPMCAFNFVIYAHSHIHKIVSDARDADP